MTSREVGKNQMLYQPSVFAKKNERATIMCQGQDTRKGDGQAESGLGSIINPCFVDSVLLILLEVSVDSNLMSLLFPSHHTQNFS